MRAAQRAAIARAREAQDIANGHRVNNFLAALSKFTDARKNMLAAWSALVTLATEREPLVEELTATGSAMRQVLAEKGGHAK